jgi:hypothetical protein
MKKYKWTKDNMFFLTRDGNITIRSSGDDNEWELFHFANQYLVKECFEEGLDEFGRNYTDKLFIRLCFAAYFRFVLNEQQGTFKSLSCKKARDRKYHVTLQWDDKAVMMTLPEMVEWLEKR